MDFGDLRAARRHGRHFRQPIEPIALAGHGGAVGRGAFAQGRARSCAASDRRARRRCSRTIRAGRLATAFRMASRLKTQYGQLTKVTQKPKFAASWRNSFTGFTRKRAGAEIEDEPRKADSRRPFAQRRRVNVRAFSRNIIHLGVPRHCVRAELVHLEGQITKYYLKITKLSHGRHSPVTAFVHALSYGPPLAG